MMIWRLDRRDAREDQVHRNKRVRIKSARSEDGRVYKDPAEEHDAEDDQEPPTSSKGSNPVGKALAKGELLLEFIADVFREDFVLLQAVDDFVVERGKFSDLILQNVLHILFAEGAEIVQADEAKGIEVGHFLLDKLGEGGPDRVAGRAGMGRF
jgi:hypothetical protein